MPSGKGENRFAYGGAYKDNQLAMDVIKYSLTILAMLTIQYNTSNTSIWWSLQGQWGSRGSMGAPGGTMGD